MAADLATTSSQKTGSLALLNSARTQMAQKGQISKLAKSTTMISDSNGQHQDVATSALASRNETRGHAAAVTETDIPSKTLPGVRENSRYKSNMAQL